MSEAPKMTESEIYQKSGTSAFAAGLLGLILGAVGAFVAMQGIGYKLMKPGEMALAPQLADAGPGFPIGSPPPAMEGQAVPPMMAMMGGGRGGAPDDENPFHQEANQKRLHDFLERLKGSTAEASAAPAQ